MITRQLALRHGRIALAKPCTISWRRALATAIEQHTSSLPRADPSALGLSSGGTEATGPSKNTPAPKFHSNYGTYAADYAEVQEYRRRTRGLGSELAPYYKPREQITRPPAPADVTLEALMAAQSHFGHATGLWHPGNARYIYGIRAGIHIISLDATASHLRRAAKIVRSTTSEGGLVLFVGTRDGHMQSVVRAAELSGGCHLFDRWIPGSITNANQILATCKKVMVDPYDRPMYGEQVPEELVNRALKPDLVVVLNPLENHVLLRECKQHHIATIGIVDTDCDPTMVTYPIPANDDSRRCTNYIAGVLGRAGEEGKLRRLELEDFKHENRIEMTASEIEEAELDRENLAERGMLGSQSGPDATPVDDKMPTSRGTPNFPIFGTDGHALSEEQRIEEDLANADYELWDLADERAALLTPRVRSLLATQLDEAEGVDGNTKAAADVVQRDADVAVAAAGTQGSESSSAADARSDPLKRETRGMTPEEARADKERVMNEQRAGEESLARLVALKRRALGERLDNRDKHVLKSIERDEAAVRAQLEESRAQMLTILEEQQKRHDAAAKELAQHWGEEEVEEAEETGLNAAAERQRSRTAHHEAPAQIGPVRKTRKGLPNRG